MKVSVGWVLLAATCSTFAAVPISSVKKEAKASSSIVRNKFIIELEESAALDSFTKRSAYAKPHDVVYSELNARGVSFNVSAEYNVSGLFVGASVTLDDEVDVAALLQIPHIKAIRKALQFAAPTPVDARVVTDPNDPSISIDAPHYLTNVDKLHAKGNFGKGIKIGIIDTGVDFNHPSLGNGQWGPGHKVVGGYDFVGDAYDGNNTPVPDDNPDDCGGHGTHVAGIIAASRLGPFNFVGVAPEASLSAYRVFGCDGSTTEEVIIDALLRGYNDGNDILNLSLGGPDGWTESSSSVIASRIAGLGTVVVMAAGNFGASGSWYTQSPANGVDVISIASLDNTILLSQPTIVHGAEHDPILYFSAFKLPIAEELPIYALSTDITIPNDACNPLPDSTPDLSKYLVIVRRGSCTFVSKVQNLLVKGAKSVLFYNNGGSLTSFSSDVLNTGFIRAPDGEWLVQQFTAGNPITISFPQDGGPIVVPNADGGLLSAFSTYGPTNDMYFKPTLTAPGGSILSTYPVELGSWSVLSGTSMAAPYAAGAIALYLADKGKTPDIGRNARSVFQSTSQRVLATRAEDAPYQSLTKQGTGLIDLFKAINTNTLVNPTELLLNDTAHFNGQHTLTVTNTGRKSQTYKLTHIAAGTALTMQEDGIFTSLGPVPLTETYASVNIQPSNLTLLAGQSAQVSVSISLPRTDASRFPVYSGWIQVGSQDDSVHVAYLGVGNSLKKARIVDNTEGFFDVRLPVVLDAGGEPQLSSKNYTFVGEDFPTLVYRLTFGSPLVRLDLVEDDIRYHPTLERRAPGGRPGHGHGHHGHTPLFTFPHRHGGDTFTSIKTVGTLAEFAWVSRNNEKPTSNENGYSTFDLGSATFSDGKAIPNGTYRILLRALKVTGNPEKDSDYESWLSPIIGFDAKISEPIPAPGPIPEE